jgi:NADH dehydrogenase
MNTAQSHRVVIVGGGAGGLELAARLGSRFGPSHITLVDANPFHVWKPSLHEVAAGTLDIHQEGLSYPMLARDRGFRFVMGALRSLDSEQRVIHIAPVVAPDGEEVLPARKLSYDTLVMAVGCSANFFNTPGAAEHAIALDSTAAAERFRLSLLKLIARRELSSTGEAEDLTPEERDAAARALHVVIVGGGATGVELAAELHESTQNIYSYGHAPNSPNSLSAHAQIAVIEGGPRLLVPLPDSVGEAARKLLIERGVQVHLSTRVADVSEIGVRDSNGKFYPADLVVWAAGIKASPLLATLGLPVNKLNQIEVDKRLRTADANIYAMGDCAAVPWGNEGKTLPARAQVANQQSTWLAKLIGARIEGKPEPDGEFVYRDHGSLVSIGQGGGVGSLMGGLAGRNMFVRGIIARMLYMSLHLMHHAAVLGIFRTGTLALGRFLTKRSRPLVKLH